MTRRTVCIAALFAAAVPALSAGEPPGPVHLYMLPPVVRPTSPQAEPQAPQVARRDPVEAVRPAPAVVIQMEQAGAFNISCSIQLSSEPPASIGLVPVAQAATVVPEPVVAPKPSPAPVSVTTGIDPAIFSCSTQPAPGGVVEAAASLGAAEPGR